MELRRRRRPTRAALARSKATSGSPFKTRGSALAAIVVAAVSCLPPAGGPAARDAPESTASARARGDRLARLTQPARGAALDIPLGPARLLPASLDEAKDQALEPGGATRAIVAGVRVLSFADGSILAAADRLPAMPSAVVVLPERLGGGVLFAIAKVLWRSDRWLSKAMPIASASGTITQVLAGLDRVYLRSTSGSLDGVDPRTGAHLDLGPLPAAPSIGPLVASDGWRALVVADLRGALLTTDAGASWRSLPLPVVPSEVELVGTDFVVGTAGGTERPERWWRVGADERVEPLVGRPRDDRATARKPPGPIPDSPARTFGPYPLLTALVDGWPLDDGTAVVARNGALARIRLSDGALVDLAPEAFEPGLARCHGVSLSRPGDSRAFGFVCGESAGKTRLFAWEAERGELVPLREFDEPRLVLSFGNGALAARGSCSAARGEDDDGRASQVRLQAWCVMSPNRRWRERRLRGVHADAARIVALSDGRLAILWPADGQGRPARLTIVDADDRTSVDVSLRFPAARGEALRAVTLGTWLEGFEERRPGVAGGWVDAAGSVVGVEVTVGGDVRVGEYIRDAGSPIAAGRWALGWTASRQGFESTDGGMTWAKDIVLPDRISQSSTGAAGPDVARSCGPLGCVAAGWLRIGWGATREPAIAAPPAPARQASRRPLPPPWRLRCKPLDPASAVVPSSGRAVSFPVMVPAAPWGALSEFPGFSGRAGPSMRSSDMGFSADVLASLSPAMRVLPVGRIYAWGPSSGDWRAGAGFWQVRWDSAWGGWRDAQASAIAPVPWTGSDVARHALGLGPGVPPTWALAPGDDAEHALLLQREGGPSGETTTDLVALEAGGSPLRVELPAGEPLPRVDSAMRAFGRWYVATPAPPGDSPATVVWEIDSGRVRERARIARLDHAAQARLARRTDGRSLGVVVEGQPDGSLPPSLFVVGLDLDTRAVGEPEPVRSVTDRSPSICTMGDGSWEFDMAYPEPIDLGVGTSTTTTLPTPVVHVRASRDGVCVDRMAGASSAFASTVAPELTAAAGTPAPVGAAADVSMDVSVVSARARYRLRCAQEESSTSR